MLVSFFICNFYFSVIMSDIKSFQKNRGDTDLKHVVQLYEKDEKLNIVVPDEVIEALRERTTSKRLALPRSITGTDVDSSDSYCNDRDHCTDHDALRREEGGVGIESPSTAGTSQVQKKGKGKSTTPSRSLAQLDTVTPTATAPSIVVRRPLGGKNSSSKAQTTTNGSPDSMVEYEYSPTSSIMI